jgi:outer membrane autotransporter protein
VYLNTAFLGALTHYKTARNLSFGTIDRCACATHDGNEWLIHAGLAYEAWQTSLCHLLPYINLDYVVQHEDGYTETGAGSLNLKVRKKNAMLFQGEAGISLSKEYETPCGIFTPLLTLAYINQTPCSNKNYRANFVNSACCFTGRGGDYERNLFAPRLALTYHDACDDINISLHYDAQVGSKKYWAQDIAFDLTLRF